MHRARPSSEVPVHQGDRTCVIANTRTIYLYVLTREECNHGY